MADTGNEDAGTAKDDTEHAIPVSEPNKREDKKSEASEPGPDVCIVERDRLDIKGQQSSKSAILILQPTSDGETHCQAAFWIPNMLRSRSNIECNYHFNLQDRTGGRGNTRLSSAPELVLFEPHHFYHISCIEHLLDLPEFLGQGWMKMEGMAHVGMLGGNTFFEAFPTLLEEWFKSNGAIFKIEEHRG